MLIIVCRYSQLQLKSEVDHGGGGTGNFFLQESMGKEETMKPPDFNPLRLDSY